MDSSGTKYGLESTSRSLAPYTRELKRRRLFSPSNAGPLGTTCAQTFWDELVGVLGEGVVRSSPVSWNQSETNRASRLSARGPSTFIMTSSHSRPLALCLGFR